MTELAAYTDPGSLEPHTPSHAAHNGLAALGEWVAVAREVYPLADTLSKTSFVPKALRDKPYEVMATILAGSEVGMQPMASLRSIDNVEGKPAFSAIALRALVQSHGHDIWVVESNDTRAVVHGRRRGSSHVEKSTWTLEMAKKAGLAGKTNWQRYAGPMLEARATGVVARRIDADGIAGMPYTTEELLDGVGLDEPPTADVDSDVPPAGVRRMSRRKPEPEPDPEPEPAEAEQGISPQQMKALQAGFKDLGIDDRGDRLNIVSTIAGRAVTSASDLSMREASEVIDRLNRASEKPDPITWLMSNGGTVDPATGELAIPIDGDFFDSTGHEPPVEDQ